MRHGRAAAIKAAVLAFCIIGAAVSVAFLPKLAAGWQPLKEKGVSYAGYSSRPREESKWGGKSANFLICGIDNTNMLTDVIMIVGFDNQNHRAAILQIPRDTYAGKNVPSHKYNAVYAHHPKGISGMSWLKSRVESDFGIKIDNCLTITTAGLRSLVNAVGGVELYVPKDMNYDDRAQNLHIHLKKGYQTLDGSQAEQYVRYRKGWVEGDIGRLNAQKSFLAGLAQKLKSMGLFKLSTQVLPAIKAPDFTTDMTALQMLQYGSAAKDINMQAVNVYTMPGESYKSEGVSYYSPDKDKLVDILNLYFVPYGRKITRQELTISEKTGAVPEQAGNGTNFQNMLDGQSSSAR